MKTKSESKYFWTRIEEGLRERGITLAELCRQQDIKYDSIISSKMHGTTLLLGWGLTYQPRQA
jgi:lambda repressor-like predicted transcriptional regulator